MITIDEAMSIICKNVQGKKKIETIPVINSLGRIVAKDIFAIYDRPFCNQSAVDGYAINLSLNLEDNSIERAFLLTDHEIKAQKKGNLPLIDIGQALRIFTGASVPSSATVVVKEEDCQIFENKFLFINKGARLDHIRPRGEEFKKGDALLLKGEKITPSIMSLLIASGFYQIKCYDLPKIAILSNGDELSKTGDTWFEGITYDSNSYFLKSSLEQLGITAKIIPIVEDNFLKIKNKFQKLFSDFDLIITSGGISVGKYDFIKPTLMELKAEILFEKVAIRPGYPISLFQKKIKAKKKSLILSLPGNPSAMLTTYFILGKKIVHRLMGKTTPDNFLWGILNNNTKSNTEKVFYPLGIFEPNLDVSLLPQQNSYMIKNASHANCLIELLPDTNYKAGDRVKIFPLNI